MFAAETIQGRKLFAEIRYMVHAALPKRPINQFKPVQQSRQQTVRAYCSKIYCGRIPFQLSLIVLSATAATPYCEQNL